MKPLIVANWKMNPATQKEAVTLFKGVKKGLGKLKNAEVAICPPFVYLPLLKGLSLGAQDAFYEEKGAFTGEISAPELTDLNVQYVIVGHSERRNYFNETNDIVNKKLKSVLRSKLTPILCIGETKEEKDANQTPEVLEKQITEGLHRISKFEIQNSKLVIAYEPIWAIGTGKSCSVDQTLSSVLFIKKVIAGLYNREAADGIRILYGGSVTSKNSADYINQGGVNGLLVGGASLDAKEFVNIVKSII